MPIALYFTYKTTDGCIVNNMVIFTNPFGDTLLSAEDSFEETLGFYLDVLETKGIEEPLIGSVQHLFVKDSKTCEARPTGSLCEFSKTLGERPTGLQSKLSKTFYNVHFPDNLMYLNCNYNCLTHLPENLPNTLQVLYCQNNKLTYLPYNLPETVLKLDCSNNYLVKLSDSLPDKIAIRFADNPFLFNMSEVGIPRKNIVVLSLITIY